MREIVCSGCDFAITESANPEGAVARRNTRALSLPSKGGREDADSGFDGDSVARAELAWANLPTARKWTSLATYEKALVVHTLARLPALSPSTLTTRERSDLQTETDWDSLALRLLNAMHPSATGEPTFLSMSDLSDDQAKRAKAGVMAVLFSEPTGRFENIDAALSALTPTAKIATAIRSLAKEKGGA